MSIVIKVENLSKAYQIGQIGTGTVSKDLERWWITKIRGREDPFLKIGETNDRSVKGKSNIVWSLKDINFEIQQGDAVGIIGRNGAGKSTLLKILSEVTSPTTGKINIKGHVASLLEVGTGFHPELTGKENIYLNGAILGMRKKEIDRKLDEIINFSGIERYIDTPVKRYSSGMYVRLAFAVAAHLEPEILIVDEVLAVGDAEFQKKCLGKMNDVSKNEGKTILFVSHNMNAIRELCNKAMILHNGRLTKSGTSSKLISEYMQLMQDSDLASDDLMTDQTLRRGNGFARFTAVEGLDKIFDYEEDILFGLQVQIYNSISNLYFSCILKNQLNNEIITTLSMIKVEYKNDMASIKMTIPGKQLRPGIYPVYLWLGGDSNTPYDVIDGIFNLKISTEKSFEQLGFYPVDHGGYFTINYNVDTVDTGKQFLNSNIFY